MDGALYLLGVPKSTYSDIRRYDVEWNKCDKAVLYWRETSTDNCVPSH